MLLKLKFTTISEMTIESTNWAEAERTRARYLHEAKSTSHHGEKTAVEILAPYVIGNDGTLTHFGDEALSHPNVKWGAITTMTPL